MVYDLFLLLFTYSHKNISTERMQKLCQLRGIWVQLEKKIQIQNFKMYVLILLIDTSKQFHKNKKR
jgi:hypothetical protein